MRGMPQRVQLRENSPKSDADAKTEKKIGYGNVEKNKNGNNNVMCIIAHIPRHYIHIASNDSIS